MNTTMKKVLSVLLVIVLVAVVSIGGTLAYLTDRDSEANVFTVGNVEIDLVEDFEQGSELIPGVKINKDVQITNTGKNDAWVWYTYAVPTALVDSGNNASKNAIHFNLDPAYWDSYASEEQKATGKTWHWEAIEHDVTIDDSGIPYTVVTVLYNTTLAAGETTPISLTQVYMDTRVDIDPDGNMAWIENGVATDLGWNVNEKGAPTIYVSAYAIQEEGFATVQDAYAAYQTQWGDNGTEYAQPGTPVSSAEELAAALAQGGKVVVTDNITVDDSIVISKDATLEVANGATLSTTEDYLLIVTGDAKLTIAGGSFNVDEGTGTGNKSVIYAYDNAEVVIENGSFNGGEGDAFNAAVWAQGNAAVTIKNGTFVNGADSAGDSGTLIYARDNSVVNIEGGYFENDGNLYWGYNWMFNTQDYSNAKIVVTGGTFVGLDPANSWPADGNCVAEGYKSVDNGDGSFTVVAE